MENRKIKESEFHDNLRNKRLEENEGVHLYLTSNKKFYSIVRTSRTYVTSWLQERCPGRKALDYCCGNGGMTIFLAKSGADATGIDVSQESINNCIESATQESLQDKAHFHVMDAENLDSPDNYFDVVVCNGVLHHLDLEKAYKELARVLKKDGATICAEPLVYNPIIQLYRRLTPHLRTPWETEHILNKKSIDLARHYFGHVETRFYHLTSLVAVPFRGSKLFYPVLSFLEAIDNLLLKLPLIKWLAWQIVFIMSEPIDKKK